MACSVAWDFGNFLDTNIAPKIYKALDYFISEHLTVALHLDYLDINYNLDIVYDLEKIYGFLSCWLRGASWGFDEGLLHPSLQQPTARLQGVASAHCPLQEEAGLRRRAKRQR